MRRSPPVILSNSRSARVRRKFDEDWERIKQQKRQEMIIRKGSVKSEAEINAMVERSKNESLIQQERIFRAVKKVKENEYMPLGEIMNLEKQTTREDAEKYDKEIFRKEVFHSDEQKEKTDELTAKHTEEKGLEGLYNPKDPGFAPMIEFDWEGMLKPHVLIQGSYSGREYRVFPLKWSMFGKDYTIVVLGKRRSGKSCFIRSLLGNYLRVFFPRVYVFTKTAASGEYAKFVPEAYIIDFLDLDLLQKIFDTQKKYKHKSRKGSFHGNMNVLIIMDDCLSENLKYKKLVNEIFYEGRHMNICFIVTSQDLKGLSPGCMANADFGIFFNVRSERDKEAMRTKFCDFMANDEEMEEVTSQVTLKKWHVIAFDQSEPSIPPEFTMFCGRAPDPPPFVLGAKKWWKHNPHQLAAIINENPELEYLRHTDDWGIIGQEEFNQVR